MADVTTSVLVNQASRVKSLKVTGYQEIEGMLTQDQMKQVLGCDSVSCAAEIAGAFNTDQIVLGSLGRLGDSYILTLTLVRARDAQVVGRSMGRFSGREEEALVDRMPATVAELFSVEAPPRVEKLGTLDGPPASSSAPGARPASTGRKWFAVFYPGDLRRPLRDHKRLLTVLGFLPMGAVWGPMLILEKGFDTEWALPPLVAQTPPCCMGLACAPLWGTPWLLPCHALGCCVTLVGQGIATQLMFANLNRPDIEVLGEWGEP
jgi:pimeloyl-ACP methyl ester carboxylesterase